MTSRQNKASIPMVCCLLVPPLPKFYTPVTPSCNANARSSIWTEVIRLCGRSLNID